MKRLVLAGLLLSLSSFSTAADVWHTSTLKWVYPQANGSFVIAFNVESPSCAAPNVPKYHNVMVGENSVTEEAARKFYAAALLALAANLTVQVNFSDSTANCFVNRLLVLPN